MPGAVGLWLWSLPFERRSGSVSVWTSEEDLRRFVTLPAHVAIMRRFKKAGRLRSATWRTDRFAAAATMGRARRWIADPASSAPGPRRCWPPTGSVAPRSASRCSSRPPPRVA